MEASTAVLVLDDGELERVGAVLERLGMSYVRHRGDEVPAALPWPQRLLVTSGRRAMRMPRLVGDATPVWVCIYDQDFAPLRDRLRELGVNYLVNGEVDGETVRLFFLQILHSGSERRSSRRIPLQGAIELETGRERRRATLIDLAPLTCRVSTDRSLPTHCDVVVHLPPEWADGEPVAFPATVVRSGTRSPGMHDDDETVEVVLAFPELEPSARALLDALFTGAHAATRVTPLAPDPLEAVPAERTPDPSWRQERDSERRHQPRHVYERRVEALHWEDGDGPSIGLGRDLSTGGVRLVMSPPPQEKARVTLALYGGAREEPVVADAEVVRVEDTETSLRFVGLSAGQRRQLEHLAGGTGVVEEIHGATAKPVVIARVLEHEQPADEPDPTGGSGEGTATT